MGRFTPEKTKVSAVTLLETDLYPDQMNLAIKRLRETGTVVSIEEFDKIISSKSTPESILLGLSLFPANDLGSHELSILFDHLTALNRTFRPWLFERLVLEAKLTEEESIAFLNSPNHLKNGFALLHARVFPINSFIRIILSRLGSLRQTDKSVAFALKTLSYLRGEYRGLIFTPTGRRGWFIAFLRPVLFDAIHSKGEDELRLRRRIKE